MPEDKTHPTDWKELYQQLRQNDELKLWHPYVRRDNLLHYRILKLRKGMVWICYKDGGKDSGPFEPKIMLTNLIECGQAYTNYWHAYAAHLQWRAELAKAENTA